MSGPHMHAVDFVQAHKTLGLYTDQVQEHAGKLFQGYVEKAESVSGKTKDVASRDAAQVISFVRKSYDYYSNSVLTLCSPAP